MTGGRRSARTVLALAPLDLIKIIATTRHRRRRHQLLAEKVDGVLHGRQDLVEAALQPAKRCERREDAHGHQADRDFTAVAGVGGAALFPQPECEREQRRGGAGEGILSKERVGPSAARSA